MVTAWRTIVLAAAAAFLSTGAASGPSPRHGQQAPAVVATDRLLTRLAIETAPDGDLEPIAFGERDEPLFMIFDRFRLVALAARDAWRKGRPLDPDNPPVDLLAARTVVVAFARTPAGPVNTPPRQIQIVRQNGRADRIRVFDQREIQALLPGVTVPPLSLAEAFTVSSLLPSDRVLVVFTPELEARTSRAPGVQPGTLEADVTFDPPKAIDTPPALVPPGLLTPPGQATVRVEGILDLAGRVRYARAVDGPGELHALAVETVGRWRYEPARMFGAPVPLVMRADVRFTK
jgi:hypothetical protein